MDISAKNKRVVDVDGKTFDTQREAFTHAIREIFNDHQVPSYYTTLMWDNRRAINEVISDFEQFKFNGSYDAPPTGDEEPTP